MFKNVYSIDFLNYCITNYEKNIHLSLYGGQNSVLYMANNLSKSHITIFQTNLIQKHFFNRKIYPISFDLWYLDRPKLQK